MQPYGASWSRVLLACFVDMVEAVTIVLAMGSTRSWGSSLIGVGAALVALVLVLGLAVALRRPLAMINENLLKYAVGMLLAAFGTYWAVEGLGIFRADRDSL